jgi:hypothetical protein
VLCGADFYFEYDNDDVFDKSARRVVPSEIQCFGKCDAVFGGIEKYRLGCERISQPRMK